MVDRSSMDNIIIIDIGSDQIKAGFAFDTCPRYTIEPIIGWETKANVTGIPKEKYFGKMGKKEKMVKNMCPVERGAITSVNEVVDIFDHICDRLSVELKESSILIGENSFTSKTIKEKLVDVLFETHHLKNLYIADQSTLVLGALNMNTGLVVQVGHGKTCTMPVYESCRIPGASGYSNFAGLDITSSLIESLKSRGHVFETFEDFEYARLLKEQHCKIIEDPNPKEFIDQTVVLTPYTSSIYKRYDIGAEKYTCVEPLFENRGPEHYGIQHLITQSINSCDAEIKPMMLKNVVLSGGTTLIPGFSKRLDNELRIRLGDLNLIEPSNRIHLSFMGAGKLVLSTAMNNLWISGNDFIETGPSIVHRKCF